MRAVVRILAVLVVSLAFTAVFLAVVAIFDVRRVDFEDDRPSAASELSGALTRAGVEPGASEASGESVCGFPPQSATFRLSYAKVVVLARCLSREGYLTRQGVRLVEDTSSIEIAGSEVGGGEGGRMWGFFSSVGTADADVIPRPWWESLLLVAAWVSGIALVTWAVGFGLPFMRPARRL